MLIGIISTFIVGFLKRALVVLAEVSDHYVL